MRVLLAEGVGRPPPRSSPPPTPCSGCTRRRDHLLGTRERIEAQIIPAAGYPLEFVPSVPLPRGRTPTSSACPVGCGRPAGPRSTWSTGSGPT